MRASSPRLAAAALAVGAALAGCGKSLPQGAGQGSTSTSVAPVSAHGAGGLATKNTTRLGGADAATDAAAVALAVNPGLTPETRPEAVVLVDERNWPLALAASALASAPLRAPLLYSEGDTLPGVSAQALMRMQPTGARALGGVQVIQIGTTATPAGDTARSLQGAEAFRVAAGVEQLVSLAQGHAPRQVIVVAADGPPALAMPAASLAAESGAPILFVTAVGIPSATTTVLAKLRRPTIYVVGPSSAVSVGVSAALRHYGTVRRIAGGLSPAENAIAVSRYSDGSFGWGVHEPGHGLAFANAARPLDGPAAAPLASSGDYAPLLLLESPNQVPTALSRYLHDIQPAYSTSQPQYGPSRGAYNHGWLIGDEQAISTAVQAQLDTLLEIAPLPRGASPGVSSAGEPEPEPSISPAEESGTP